MVIEIEKELVATRIAARASGDITLLKCCMMSGVHGEASSPAFAPEVKAESMEEAIPELDNMVNSVDVPVEQARMIRLYLALKGHVNSQYIAAVNFRDGRNIIQHSEAARYWMEKAAENGNAGAQNDLGVMYAGGIGGVQDPEKAIFWYMKSVEGGNVTAKGNLGRNLAQGWGTKRNYFKAARLLKESLMADPYDAWDHLLLARCYEHGVGGRNGRRLAMHHYQEASDFGLAAAREALRRMKA